jgi:hypothetical protein
MSMRSVKEEIRQVMYASAIQNLSVDEQEFILGKLRNPDKGYPNLSKFSKVVEKVIKLLWNAEKRDGVLYLAYFNPATKMKGLVFGRDLNAMKRKVCLAKRNNVIVFTEVSYDFFISNSWTVSSDGVFTTFES